MQALFDFALQIGTHVCFHFVDVTIHNSKCLGKLRIELRQLRRFHFCNRDGERCCFTRDFFALIIVREFQIEGFALARLEASGVDIKLGKHLARAQHKRKVFRRTTIESDAVNLTDEVDGHTIIFHTDTISSLKFDALFAQGFDCVVDIRVGDRSRRLFYLERRQITDHDFRINLERRDKLKRSIVCCCGFVGALIFLCLNPRIACDANILRCHGVREIPLNCISQHLGPYLRPVGGCDHFERHLAGPKSLHAYCARQLLQAAGNFPLNLAGRDDEIEATLKCADGFDVDCHDEI